MTLGKSSAAACRSPRCSRRTPYRCFEHGDQGGTYNGNPLMAAVGGAVMDAVLAPGFLERRQARGRQLTKGLASLSAATRARRGPRPRAAGRARPERDIARKVVGRRARRRPAPQLAAADSLRFMPALNLAGEIEAMLGMLDGVLGKTLRG